MKMVSFFGLCVLLPGNRIQQYKMLLDIIDRAGLLPGCFPNITDKYNDDDFEDVNTLISENLSNKTINVGTTHIDGCFYIGIIGLDYGISLPITQEILDAYSELSSSINEDGHEFGVKCQLGFYTFDL